MKKAAIILTVLVVLAAVYDFWVHKHPEIMSSGSGTKTTQKTTPPATATVPSFNKSRYSKTDPASIWVVVNKQNALTPLTYAPVDLTSVGHGQYLRAEAAQALSAMIAGAKAAGLVLTPASGYRSYATQVSVYNNEVKAFGQSVADSESARPGYSEHQTGWAIDLGSGACSIQDCFGDTPGGKWAIANAYIYGFILRYPANLSDVTGYRNETWHFRYVGPLLAGEMHKQKIQTLEQFFEIPGGPAYKS